MLSQHDRARDAALNVMRFLNTKAAASTPCRVGTGKAATLMEAPQWDEELLDDLAQVMADASICGLGQAAPNPIRCIHKYFPHEVGEGPWPGDLPKPRNSPLANCPRRPAMSALPHTPGGVAFELDGQPITAHPGETILKAAQRQWRGDSAPVLHRRPAPRRQPPRLRGRDRGRAHAGPSCCRAPTGG